MTAVPSAPPRTRCLIAVALLALLALAALPSARAAAATYGGVSAVSPEAPADPEAPDSPPAPEAPPTGPAGKASLVNGRAIAPADAPLPVKQVIAAANRIRTTPYIWGGGHGRWWDRGYDCSGSVSYALHGGGLLNIPMVSGSLARWGAPGRGRWITLYANAGHVYAVIAGLRWDTAGNTSGTGPRWHSDSARAAGFAVRHPVGY